MSTAQNGRVRYSGFLGSQSLFSLLTRQIQLELESKLIFSKPGTGALIYHQGDRARGVILVFAGRIKVFALAPHARTALLKVAGPGDALGLAAAVLECEHLATAQATEPSVVALLRRDDLMSAMHKYADFSKAVARHLALECTENANSTLSLRVPSSSSQRLAATLLHLANRPGIGNGFGKAADLVYTHADLAQLIGASRETVTRLMKRFEDKAIVAARRSTFTITDPSLLQEIAGIR